MIVAKVAMPWSRWDLVWALCSSAGVQNSEVRFYGLTVVASFVPHEDLP